VGSSPTGRIKPISTGGAQATWTGFSKARSPGDLPIEQPNAIRASHQSQDREGTGLTIPQTLLLRADHVIEEAAATEGER
jgi:hypothetical protein